MLGWHSAIDLSFEVAKQGATKLPYLRPHYAKSLISRFKPVSLFVPFRSWSFNHHKVFKVQSVRNLMQIHVMMIKMAVAKYQAVDFYFKPAAYCLHPP